VTAAHYHPCHAPRCGFAPCHDERCATDEGPAWTDGARFGVRRWCGRHGAEETLRAFEIVAACVIAASAYDLMAAAFPLVHQSYLRGLWLPPTERAIAALCGVSVETVRGWLG